MSFELVRPGTKIDFLSKWKICLVLSLGFILLSAVVLKINGLKFGVDFEGGTEVHYRFAQGVNVEDDVLRGLVGDLGFEDVSIVRFGAAAENEFLVRFKGDLGEQGERVQELREEVTTNVGAIDTGRELRVEFVGPKVGQELRKDGLLALFYACILILGYIWLRFTWRFAPGAVVAIMHDVLITAGFFVLLGYEFDLRVLAALLAIIGYSLNDTIIVYDRIRENMELHTKTDLAAVVNESVNQTLSRTFLTSITTLFAVLSLLFLGGEVIRPFALAMTIGVLVGTYSSIYIAAPTFLFLEKQLGKPEDAKAKRSKQTNGARI